MAEQKVYGGRDLLNLPGYHSTAAIVAEVVLTNDPWSRAEIVISDCTRTISLEFSPGDPDSRENDLHKIDTMIRHLKEFRKGYVIAQRKAAKRT